MQERSALQKEREAAQMELRKTQQLLRQLERQLAKAHMTRKDSANALNQLQVSFILLPQNLAPSAHAAATALGITVCDCVKAVTE